MSIEINQLKLDIDMGLMTQLSHLDRFDASWNSIEKREGASLKQLKSIATVKSVGASTRIEGSKMSDDEVAVLIDKIDITHLELRDQQEVAGYFETLDTITENFESIEITESQIKGLHNLLLKHGEKDAWHRGQYKQHSNAVEATLSNGTKQLIFRTTDPGFPTQDAMNRLIDWYEQDTYTLPLIKTALFVYEFLSIHPFQDGNGRLSRLLASLLLLKNGYAWIQYISFENEIENRKSEYYKVLMDTQRNRPGENVTAWLQFFISCLNNIQRNLFQKLDQHKNPALGLSLREQRILFFIQNYPGSKSGEIAQKLDIALPTVKKTLKDLTTKNLVSKTGIGRSTAYLVV
jgi:Fic family protein